MLCVLPISLQYAVGGAGGACIAGALDALDSDTLYCAQSILFLVAANLCAGLMTMACFTVMMTLSQSAAPRVQTSHYSHSSRSSPPWRCSASLCSSAPRLSSL